jgi:hypothetical protein
MDGRSLHELRGTPLGCGEELKRGLQLLRAWRIKTMLTTVVVMPFSSLFFFSLPKVLIRVPAFPPQCNGKVKLALIPEPPAGLMRMLTGVGAESNHFRDNIRLYNSCLALASAATGRKPRPTDAAENPTTGIHQYKMAGSLHHYMGLRDREAAEQPGVPAERPCFAELWIIDPR